LGTFSEGIPGDFRGGGGEGEIVRLTIKVIVVPGQGICNPIQIELNSYGFRVRFLIVLVKPLENVFPDRLFLKGGDGLWGEGR
jgi:hypothetical protein